MKDFPNKISLAFVIFFFSAYLLQQPQRREDWPFSYFGMYKGGRYLTKPLFKFRFVFSDGKRIFSPYDYPIDYYFVDERLREILLGTKEAVNNELISLGTRIIPEKKEVVDEFIQTNILPVIRSHCKECLRGTVRLEIDYWNYMEYQNFKRPDRSFTYTTIAYEP